MAPPRVEPYPTLIGRGSVNVGDVPWLRGVKRTRVCSRYTGATWPAGALKVTLKRPSRLGLILATTFIDVHDVRRLTTIARRGLASAPSTRPRMVTVRPRTRVPVTTIRR